MGKNCNSCFDYKLMKNAANAIEKTSYSLNLETFGSELEVYIDTLKSYDKTHSILERTLDDFTDYTTKVKSCGSELANLYMGIQKGVEAYEEAEGKTSTFLSEFADTIEKYLGNKTVAGYLRNDKIVNKDTFATSRNDFLDNVSEETQLFISQYAMYLDQNCPPEYNSSDEWRKALIEAYKSQGYSTQDAHDLAYTDMAKWRVAQTGARVVAGSVTSIFTEEIESLRDNPEEASDIIETFPIEDDVKESSPTPTNKTTPSSNENPVEESGTKQGSYGGSSSVTSGTTNNGPSNISYRVEESQTTSTTNSPPSYQPKVETPSSNTPTDNNTQQTPSDNTNSNNTANNDNGSQSGNTSNSGDSGNSSSQERPNTGNNTDNSNNTGNSNNSNAGNNNNNSNAGNSNNNNNNNNNNNTGNGTEEIPTPPTTGDNTGTNPGNENNGGIINTTPPGNTGTGNTNNSNPNYSSGNNTGNNYGNNEPTIIPNPGTGNNNAATTTPSAPDSDAGIIDNSGETLDVISIDKDSSKTQPSTTSNDGGSVIPVILGVGAAGAAAVAGAKFIHDKKEKENTYTYDDDSSTDNTNFSYESSENEQESSEDPYDAVMQPNTKYKAGNVNKLVLDDAPTDLNIRNDIPDNNTKEELE